MCKKHKASLLKRVSLPSVFIITAACGNTRFVSPKQLVPRTDSDQNIEVITSQRKNSDDALQAIFKLQRPTVGIAQIKNNEVPVISPIAVHDDNIIFQIERCDSQVIIDGIYETFDDEHPDLASAESAKDYFQRNKFWTDITKKCTSVSKTQPQRALIDVSAPSGNWKWYIRACLPENEKDVFSCSNVITASYPLLGFKNKLNAAQQLLLSRINDKLQAINSISISLPENGRELLNAMNKCEGEETNIESEAKYKSSLLNLIGFGSSIVFEIFGPTETSKKTWSDKFQFMWNPTESARSNGKSATQILAWLFTQKHDFNKSCTQAENIKVSASTAVLKLKTLQTQLASDLDEAERLGLPLPTEVSR